MEDPPTVEYTTKAVAELMQKYTQKGGVRPFGVTCLFSGFMEGTPKLFKCEPSGAFTAWGATAIGRNSKELSEFFEKKWEKDLDQDASIRLALETLLEVVDDHKNIEICI